MVSRCSIARPATREPRRCCLLHGFPTSSIQYRELIDRLSDRFHLVAPDYPGFGYTAPLEGTTTFERLADVLDGFVDAVELDHYGLYVFDFGAPVGFRLAMRHPERVDALIVQNGNAYEAGIGPNLAGLAPYWEDRACRRTGGPRLPPVGCDARSVR